MIDSNDTKLRANNFKLSPITWSNFVPQPHTGNIKGEMIYKVKIERIYFSLAKNKLSSIAF